MMAVSVSETDHDAIELTVAVVVDSLSRPKLRNRFDVTVMQWIDLLTATQRRLPFHPGVIDHRRPLVEPTSRGVAGDGDHMAGGVLC